MPLLNEKMWLINEYAYSKSLCIICRVSYDCAVVYGERLYRRF